MLKLLHVNDQGESKLLDFDFKRIVYSDPVRAGTGSKIPMMYDLKDVGQVPIMLQTPVLRSQWGAGNFKGTSKNHNIDFELDAESPLMDQLRAWDEETSAQAVARRAEWFPALQRPQWNDGDISRLYKAVTNMRIRKKDGAAFPPMLGVRYNQRECGFFDSKGLALDPAVMEEKDLTSRAVVAVNWLWIGDKTYSISFYADQFQLRDPEPTEPSLKKKKMMFV